VVISIYDIQRAVADKATEWEMSNDEFGMSNCLNFGLRVSAFALPPVLVGDPKRIALVAADLVAHFDKRVEAMEGKPKSKCGFGRAGLQSGLQVARMWISRILDARRQMTF